MLSCEFREILRTLFYRTPPVAAFVFNQDLRRGVATNKGLGGPASNRDLFCIVRTNVV